jgi:hypothetical protein
VLAFCPLSILSNFSCFHATSRALPDSDSTTSKARASLSAASSGSRHSMACHGVVVGAEEEEEEGHTHVLDQATG